MLTIVFFALSCQDDYDEEVFISETPFDINSFFVYSEDCKSIFYSSNRNDLFQVERIDLLDEKKDFEISAVKVPMTQDVFIRDVSKDCKYLTLVSDKNGNQVFDVYTYNMENSKLSNISNSPKIDDGSPKFSPDGERLAYLSSNLLVIHDLISDEIVYKSPFIYKSFSFSTHSSRIFLEDFESNIWILNSNSYQLEKLWDSPKKSYVPKMFSFFDQKLLFISDHSGFSRIYIIDLKTKKIDVPVNVRHDIYSPQVTVDNSMYFRMNQRGSFFNYSLMPDGELKKLDSSSTGVSYQSHVDKGLKIKLFSELNVPKTFLIETTIKNSNVLNQRHLVETQSKAIEYFSDEGMSNYIFIPKQKDIKGWVLWLHGGPHMQVSPRYNLFFNTLNHFSYGVICINYKGSTGIGNNFEMRETPPQKLIDVQIKDIKKNLDKIKHLLDIEYEPITIIGISYGAALSHKFMKEYPELISGIVDFSGICCFLDVNDELPDLYKSKSFLFISGVNDYAMNGFKKKLIKLYDRKAKVKVLSIDGEGHYIRRRNSLTESAKAILNFLNED